MHHSIDGRDQRKMGLLLLGRLRHAQRPALYFRHAADVGAMFAEGVSRVIAVQRDTPSLFGLAAQFSEEAPVGPVRGDRSEQLGKERRLCMGKDSLGHG